MPQTDMWPMRSISSESRRALQKVPPWRREAHDPQMWVHLLGYWDTWKDPLWGLRTVRNLFYQIKWEVTCDSDPNPWLVSSSRITGSCEAVARKGVRSVILEGERPPPQGPAFFFSIITATPPADEWMWPKDRKAQFQTQMIIVYCYYCIRKDFRIWETESEG